MDKTLGVLMPVYIGDTVEFFTQAWDSIYNQQTRKADEYVVVKDGPVTNDVQKFLDMLRGFQDVTILDFKINKGLPYVLNAGVKIMSSAWIIRADSDDINLPNRLQRIYDTLSLDYVLYTSPILEFIDDPDTITSIRGCSENFNFMVTNPVNHPSSAFSREAFIEVGGYRDFKFFEDIDLWMRMTKRFGKIRCDAEALVKFRMNSYTIGRRRGWNYFRCEYRFLKQSYSEDSISKLQFYSRVFLGLIVRNIPVSFYRFGVSRFLRKKYD